MSLAQYKQKRRFDETPEPDGKVKNGKTKKLEFVVQKHHASHLHYDFRLEMHGVLKSWAVPKGPSLNPGDKRLAMMVEDHPYEYRKFEGIIPAGNYGAGNVIIWDRGWYEPRAQSDDPEKTLLRELKARHITFIMHGEKLNGEFALVKNDNMEKNAWLLIKKNDSEASTKDITKQDKSVVSGRLVDEIDIRPAKLNLSKYPKANMPIRVRPMLATLTNGAFDKHDWVYEIKWDGYRAIGSWDGKKCELYSRNGNSFSSKFPEIAEQLGSLDHRVVLDGEIVAVDQEGRSHFEWLQNWGRKHEGQLIYYAFDILWCDGHDLKSLSLVERKAILKEALTGSGIRYSDHVTGQGQKFYDMASKQELEGIMAKNAQSQYRQNYRSKQWLKIKTHKRQEAVIGGFTEPKGSRKDIGALVLGVHEGKKLIYVGHTGGGIPSDQMPALRRKLESLERKTSPFANKFKPNAPVHWARPKLVCEVSFAEWTSDGHMRQPIFAGMREDKQPDEVHKEQPVAVSSTPAANKSKNEAPKIDITHRDKLFFPKAGLTKGDLYDYYDGISSIMLPYLKDRPCNLLRQPNGIDGQSFSRKIWRTIPNG